jgi:hypothetical protein
VSFQEMNYKRFMIYLTNNKGNLKVNILQISIDSQHSNWLLWEKQGIIFCDTLRCSELGLILLGK